MDNPSEILIDNKILLIKVLVRVICKSFMPTYYLINSIIILLGILKLKSENIYTFEKSKLLYSSKIDTLFISKTGTLCDDKFEVNGYHPVCANHHNLNTLGFRTYNVNQNKEINLQLVKYYKNYLDKQKEKTKVSYNNNVYDKFNTEKIRDKSCEYSTLFLECLLSCNNLEKYGMEVFGNSVDSEIFRAMKWDIKADINYNNIINTNDFSYHKTDNNDNSAMKTRNDIFPNNYYKITESVRDENKNENKSNSENSNENFFSKILETNEEEKNQRRNSVLTNNIIEMDTSQTHINSYKLRIYKRFINNCALVSSSITYNFITKELRFNTKGIPENILDKCNPYTIPDNFDKIISFYRRRGFIVIICASRKISMEQYCDNDPEEKYMNDLTFYGFVTLKNKLKNEVVYALNDLRAFNINFVISTGDDIYYTLPVGFESTILDNKNIYSFDKDEIKNRIVIRKIYNSNNNSYKNEEENENDGNINTDKNTSRISKNYYKGFERSPILMQSTIFGNPDNNFNNYLKTDKIVEPLNLDADINNSNNIRNTLNGSNSQKNRNTRRVYNNGMISTSKDFLNSNEPKNSIMMTNRQMKKNLQTSRKNINSLEFKNPNFDSTKKIYNLVNSKRNMSKFSHDTSTMLAMAMPEKNKVLYYYQGILEEHKELTEDCIYCVSGSVFEFLYQNKNKRHAKMLLETIHEKCRIFFNMSSLSKSKVIDYYREFPNKFICTIGECQSDIDPILTSNIGINLQAPRNINTILSHFYSPEANLLIIKRILRSGRAIQENHLLMTISGCLYTLIINSYIICCFIRKMDVIQGQLNLLEIAFLIFQIHLNNFNL